MSATTPIYVPKLRGDSCFLLIKLQQIEAATTKITSLWTFPISLPRSRGNCRSLKCSRPEGSGAVGSTGWGACCRENTEASEEAGGCPPSLDGIAGGLCVGIAKINWIPVILWKCDSVMWSYESTLVILTIETLKSACLCCCSQQMTKKKHWSKPCIPQSYRCYLNLFLVSRCCVFCVNAGRAQSRSQPSVIVFPHEPLGVRPVQISWPLMKAFRSSHVTLADASGVCKHHTRPLIASLPFYLKTVRCVQPADGY